MVMPNLKLAAWTLLVGLACAGPATAQVNIPDVPGRQGVEGRNIQELYNRALRNGVPFQALFAPGPLPGPFAAGPALAALPPDTSPLGLELAEMSNALSGKTYFEVRNLLRLRGYEPLTIISGQADIAKTCAVGAEDVCATFPETESCISTLVGMVCDFSWRGDKGDFLVTALLGRLKIPMVNGLETTAARQAERNAVARAQ